MPDISQNYNYLICFNLVQKCFYALVKRQNLKLSLTRLNQFVMKKKNLKKN